MKCLSVRKSQDILHWLRQTFLNIFIPQNIRHWIWLLRADMWSITLSSWRQEPTVKILPLLSGTQRLDCGADQRETAIDRSMAEHPVSWVSSVGKVY